MYISREYETLHWPRGVVVVVVCLPRTMEEMGRLQFSDNCQFPHRRLEPLEQCEKSDGHCDFDE